MFGTKLVLRRRTVGALMATAAIAAGMITVSSATAAPFWGGYYPVPRDSGSGERIVYSQTLMHVWVVNAAGQKVRDYPVTGRDDWPVPGTYSVYSKSPTADNPEYKARWRHFVRFAKGHRYAIGFHDIPINYAGQPVQTEDDLGMPGDGAGCVRQSTGDAVFLYKWARIGTKVVVLE